MAEEIAAPARAEAYRAADGSWRVNGDLADMEGLQAARARVAALESDLAASADALAVALSRESDALRAAEGLETALGVLREEAKLVTGERDTARADLMAVRLEIQAQAADLASRDSEIQGLNRRLSRGSDPK